MNRRKRVAFFLALTMILASLPLESGIAYASVLSEEDGMILAESVDKALETEDSLLFDEETESDEQVISDNKQDILSDSENYKCDDIDENPILNNAAPQDNQELIKENAAMLERNEGITVTSEKSDEYAGTLNLNYSRSQKKIKKRLLL